MNLSDIFPSAGLLWRIVSTDQTVVRGHGYMADVSGGTLEFTLPAVPVEGYNFAVMDFTGTCSTTNKIILRRNGNKIMGLSEDMEITTQYASLTLVYSNATRGWRITSITPTAETGGVGTNPRKNIIINGNGIVHQYAHSTGASITDNEYFTDRWVCRFTSGTWIARHQEYSTSNIWLGGISTASAVSLGASDYIQPAVQRIEGYNVRHLAKGATVTLSFNCLCSETGTFAVRLYVIDDSSVGRQIVKEFTIDTPYTIEKKVITIDIPEGYVGYDKAENTAMSVSIGTIAGSTYQGSPDIWTTSAVYCTSDCTQWTNNTNADFRVGDVQLEVGETATDFEVRPPQLERLLCYRYYWKPAQFSGIASQYNPAFCRLNTIQFPVFMRNVPSIDITDPTFVGYSGTPGSLYSTSVNQVGCAIIYNWTSGTQGYSHGFVNLDIIVDSEL